MTNDVCHKAEPQVFAKRTALSQPSHRQIGSGGLHSLLYVHPPRGQPHTRRRPASQTSGIAGGAAEAAARMPARRPYSSAAIATPPTTAAATAKDAADAAQDRRAASCWTCICCTAASTARNLWQRQELAPADSQ